MAIIRKNNLTGVADAGSVTTGNSSGTGENAWSSVSGGANASISSGEIVVASVASAVNLKWTGLGLSTPGAVRCKIRFGSTNAIANFIDVLTSGSARIAALGINGSGNFCLRNNLNSTVGTSPITRDTTKTYAAELSGTGVTNQATATVFEVSTFGVETQVWTSTQTVGAPMSFDQAQYGRSTATAAGAFIMSGFKVADAIGVIGPDNVPPTLTMDAPVNCLAGDPFSFTLHGNDLDGAITGYTTSVIAPSTTTPTLSGASTDTVTGTAPAAGSFVTLQGQVTDSGGLTSPLATTELRVLKTSATSIDPLPFDTIKTGSWTRVGAQATDGAALKIANDTDYMESGALTSSSQDMWVQLEPTFPQASGAPHIRIRKTDTGSATVIPKLYEEVAGVATLRKTYAALTLTTSFAQVDLTLASADAATFGSFGKWWLKLEATT